MFLSDKLGRLSALLLIAAVFLSGCGLLQDAEALSGPPEDPIPAAGEEDASRAEEADSNALRFQISQAESEARFTLGEILRGQDKTIVGTTDQVFGEIVLDLADPGSVQVSAVQVNARTLVTDNNLRNRAVNNWILETGDYEFISFAPAAITGLPESVAIGQAYSLEIAGVMTIRDIKQEEVFQVTITPVSQERLEGNASTTIMRSDYNLTIPNVPNVAGVDEEVTLEIAFVAVPTG